MAQDAKPNQGRPGSSPEKGHSEGGGEPDLDASGDAANGPIGKPQSRAVTSPDAGRSERWR